MIHRQQPSSLQAARRVTMCAVLAICAAMLGGCGTTRRTDTARTASEQLLISNAVDQAVAQLDFAPIAGKNVYFDSQYLAGTVDEKYLISTLRQHLLHHGCVLQADKAKAEYVVEARAGALGTDRHDITVGVPAVNLPTAVMAAGVPPAIPEIPFAKSTDQKGVAKIAVFAYEQESGKRVWQSGVAMVTSNAKDTWILGMGPFQRGSIYDGTAFVGAEVLTPFSNGKTSKRKRETTPNRQTLANVTNETIFLPPPAYLPDSTSATPVPTEQGAVQASHQAPAPSPQTDTPPPAAAPAPVPTASPQASPPGAVPAQMSRLPATAPPTAGPAAPPPPQNPGG